MKRWMIILIVFIFFVLATYVHSDAADDNEKKMDEVSSNLDKESHDPGEAKKVEARIEDRFGVTDAQIDNLRKQNLGYGEISTVFSLSKQIPGGINDQNIQKIMDMRQEGGHKVGWGKIAQKLDLKLGPAVKDTDRIRNEAHEQRMETRNRSEQKENRVREHRDVDDGSTVGNSMKFQMPSGSHGGGNGHGHH